MACFERQGRVSSGAGAELRGRRTWGLCNLPTATRHRLEDCLNWPEALAPWSVRGPNISFDSPERKQDSTLRHSSRPCCLCEGSQWHVSFLLCSFLLCYK